MEQKWYSAHCYGRITRHSETVLRQLNSDIGRYSSRSESAVGFVLVDSDEGPDRRPRRPPSHPAPISDAALWAGDTGPRSESSAGNSVPR